MQALIAFTEQELDAFARRAASAAVDEYIARQSREGNVPMVQELITRKEACHLLKCSLPTLDSLIKTGQLKSINIGRSIKLNAHVVNDFINMK